MWHLRKIMPGLFVVGLGVGGGGGCKDSGPGAAYYGEQGGERVLAAEGNGKNPLRARKEQPFFKLKNLRKGGRKFGKESLSVDWEETKTGERPPSMFIVVKSPDKNLKASQEVSFRAARGEKSGTVTLEVAFGAGSMADMPVDTELYLAARSPQWSDLSFKLSNSVKLGSAEYTYARNWTQQEIERIAKIIGPPATAGTATTATAGAAKTPPNAPAAAATPAHTNPPPGFPPSQPRSGASAPQLTAEFGEDTAWVGNASGGSPQRAGDKDKPLRGFNFSMGNWAGGPCLAKLIPVFSTDAPPSDQKPVHAQAGYAAAGLQVHADTVVRGVQVIFMKLNADGTLNAADTYVSELAGAPAAAPQKLGGDGRRMLGVHLRQGLIIDALAVVMQK